VYAERIDAGVAREQARKDLPLSTYTEAYWKIDLHNLLHFLELRLHPAAQLEIRRYAEVIASQLLAAWCPITYEAFCDYRLQRVEFSAPEVLVTRRIEGVSRVEGRRLLVSAGFVVRDSAGALMFTREGREFFSKVTRLGLGRIETALSTLVPSQSGQLVEATRHGRRSRAAERRRIPRSSGRT
jgi:thymidylate synthase (FAD)